MEIHVTFKCGKVNGMVSETTSSGPGKTWPPKRKTTCQNARQILESYLFLIMKHYYLHTTVMFSSLGDLGSLLRLWRQRKYLQLLRLNLIRIVVSCHDAVPANPLLERNNSALSAGLNQRVVLTDQESIPAYT
jgi:hypothetical protein